MLSIGVLVIDCDCVCDCLLVRDRLLARGGVCMLCAVGG